MTATSAIDGSVGPADRRAVGILGGTFNPPHLGHLAVARRALEELALERVVLMPTYAAAHKPEDDDPGPEHRLQMCRLSIGDTDGLSVCALEIERRGPSYTVDTLEAIHASDPDAQLTFIAGADTASTLPAWREPLKVLQLADLAVAARSGSARREVIAAVASLPASLAATGSELQDEERAVGAVRFLDMPVLEISSSTARRRVAQGMPIEDLVGPAVATYIADHGLYRATTGSPAEANG